MQRDYDKYWPALLDGSYCLFFSARFCQQLFCLIWRGNGPFRWNLAVRVVCLKKLVPKLVPKTSKMVTTHQTLRFLELLLGDAEVLSVTASVACAQNEFFKFLFRPSFYMYIADLQIRENNILQQQLWLTSADSMTSLIGWLWLAGAAKQPGGRWWCVVFGTGIFHYPVTTDARHMSSDGASLVAYQPVVVLLGLHMRLVWQSCSCHMRSYRTTLCS